MATSSEDSARGIHYFENGHCCAKTPGHALDEPTPTEASEDVVAQLKAVLASAGHDCIRLFVAGAVTHVGKTSVCLGLLASLRKAGVHAKEIAYIKPATQCEAPDLLARWCADEGIEHVSGESAPLVFYQGFTRSFLAGEQGTSEQWIEKIADRIDRLAAGRRILIVDGVGFPAVGSIVGVDNADVARAARAPVLIVCKSGVGAAVDSFSLNSTYFLAKGVPVLGGVFNLGDLQGFNSWETCAENIELWFSRQPRRRERYYGVIPMAPELDGLRERISETDTSALEALVELNARHFAAHADLAGIIGDAAADPWNRRGLATTLRPVASLAAPESVASIAAPESVFKPASREAVTSTAKKAGAKGGG